MKVIISVKQRMKLEQGLAKSSSLRSMVSNFLDLLVTKVHQCSHSQSSVACGMCGVTKAVCRKKALSMLLLVLPCRNDEEINLHIQGGTVSYSLMKAVVSSGMFYPSTRLHGASS